MFTHQPVVPSTLSLSFHLFTKLLFVAQLVQALLQLQLSILLLLQTYLLLQTVSEVCILKPQQMLILLALLHLKLKVFVCRQFLLLSFLLVKLRLSILFLILKLRCAKILSFIGLRKLINASSRSKILKSFGFLIV